MYGTGLYGVFQVGRRAWAGKGKEGEAFMGAHGKAHAKKKAGKEAGRCWWWWWKAERACMPHVGPPVLVKAHMKSIHRQGILHAIQNLGSLSFLLVLGSVLPSISREVYAMQTEVPLTHRQETTRQTSPLKRHIILLPRAKCIKKVV